MPELRFAAASFDAVVAANVLHLVPDLPGALASLRRIERTETIPGPFPIGFVTGKV